MDHGSLYDDDILLWSEQQAAALRRLGSRKDVLPNDLDLENVAEEIEDVGKSQLKAFRSMLRQILVHFIKAYSLRNDTLSSLWMKETKVFRDDAIDQMTRSMLGKIDMDRLWEVARARADADLSGHGDEIAADLPEQSPFTVEELLDEGLSLETALERISRAARGGDAAI